MKQYVTEIKAISPVDGELKTYCGPEVPGISFGDAQAYCENNGLGYCRVTGELVADIPCKPGTHEPDMSKIVHYDTQSDN